MIKIKAPKEYYNEPEILSKSGIYIKEYGSRALIIGSKTSFEVAGGDLMASLEESGIKHRQYEFSGYVTKEKAEEIATEYRYAKVDVVIGLGGGRVIDTAKLVATHLKAATVTIPTIAAQCASWAAVSIVYDNEGRFVDGIFNTVGPELILADTKLLFEAPHRYLYAGIVDSYAKWYEIYPYKEVEGEGGNTFLQTMILIAGQLKDILDNQTQIALEKYNANGEIGDEAIKVIDAIIYLAGLSGSLQTDILYQGIAHPMYNALSHFPETGHLLHGEKVGFGILLQQVLEKKSDEEIEAVIELFVKLGNTLTLEDIGLANEPEKVKELAESLYGRYAVSLNRLGYGFSAEEIEDGLYIIDRKIRESKNYRKFEI
jgi:glycerol dehydrogenase